MAVFIKLVGEGEPASMSLEDLALVLAPLIFAQGIEDDEDTDQESSGPVTDIEVSENRVGTISGPDVRIITWAQLDPAFQSKTRGELFEKLEEILLPYGIRVMKDAPVAT